MSTHEIEPMKYSVNRSDDYVTGWNDCYAAIDHALAQGQGGDDAL